MRRRGPSVLEAIFFFGFAAVAGVAASPEAYAQSCGPDVDLTQDGGSMHGVPTVVQDGNDCFAFTACSTADAWRRSHPPLPPGFSSTYSSSGTKLNRDLIAAGLITPEKGGYPNEALEYLREHPTCDQHAMFGGSKWVEPRGFRKSLTQIYEIFVKPTTQSEYGKSVMRRAYGSILARHPDWTPELLALQGMYEFHEAFQHGDWLCNSLQKYGAYLPPSTAAATTSQILDALLARESPDAFVDAFLKKACEGTVAQNTLPPVHHLRTRDDAALIATIDRSLDAPNGQPVTVGFCSAVLSHPRPYRGRRSGVTQAFFGDCEDAKFRKSDKKAGLQNHAVLVVGRRTNPKSGECEYLVRNSWGIECKGYAELDSHWDCRGAGDLWVNAKDLAANSFDLTWLDGKANP